MGFFKNIPLTGKKLGFFRNIPLFFYIKGTGHEKKVLWISFLNRISFTITQWAKNLAKKSFLKRFFESYSNWVRSTTNFLKHDLNHLGWWIFRDLNIENRYRIAEMASFLYWFSSLKNQQKKAFYKQMRGNLSKSLWYISKKSL